MGKQRRRAVRLAAQKRREVASAKIAEVKAVELAAEAAAKLIEEAKKKEEEEKRRIVSRARASKIEKIEKDVKRAKEDPTVKGSVKLKPSRFKKEGKEE
tara:strand:- start:392 stop:688 length:297 start_codon:yes stop_codon:yes gene_type:complete